MSRYEPPPYRYEEDDDDDSDDEYEGPKPIRLLPTLFAIISCFMIFLLPTCEEKSWACLTICLITSGLYFMSTHLLWGGTSGWKFDFFLGILWLMNAGIHLFVLVATYLPKLE